MVTPSNLPGIFGAMSFGQPLWTANLVPQAYIIISPGILGTEIFGQPLWVIPTFIPNTGLPTVALPGLLGDRIFGQPLWTADILTSSNTSANLCGWTGWNLFGQPLWIVNEVPILYNVSVTIFGGALVQSPSNLPFKGIVTILGMATIQR